MLSSFRTALVVLVASAIAVNAAPSLTIKTSTPNVEVDGVQNLKVVITIINTGDETLKLLNDPRGVLSPFPEDSFTIISADGYRPSFNGAKVSYTPTHAASLDDPNGSTVLAPGTSTDVTHDLSAAYNFTRSGAGDYSIEPSNLFTYVDGDGTLKNLYAAVEDVAEIKLSGNLAVSRRVYDKRDDERFIQCSQQQKHEILEAAIAAERMAGESYMYLNSHSDSTERYRAWFGPSNANTSSSGKELVEEHFKLISTADITNFYYECTKRYQNCNAFVDIDRFGKMYICEPFWKLPESGSGTRAGELIHETSHFERCGETYDYVRGKVNCAKLARIDPHLAVINADSHQFFAENDPYLE